MNALPAEFEDHNLLLAFDANCFKSNSSLKGIAMPATRRLPKGRVSVDLNNTTAKVLIHTNTLGGVVYTFKHAGGASAVRVDLKAKDGTVKKSIRSISPGDPPAELEIENDGEFYGLEVAKETPAQPSASIQYWSDLDTQNCVETKFLLKANTPYAQMHFYPIPEKFYRAKLSDFADCKVKVYTEAPVDLTGGPNKEAFLRWNNTVDFVVSSSPPNPFTASLELDNAGATGFLKASIFAPIW